MSGGFRCENRYLASSLVLRVANQDSSNSRNDFSGFRSYRVLREIPGHSGQRWLFGAWGWAGRLGLPGLVQLFLPAAVPVVVRVLCVPGAVGASMACTSALGRAAGALAGPHAWVGKEPTAAHRARALLLHAADDCRPLTRCYELTCRRLGGSFLASRPGSILDSAEGLSARTTRAAHFGHRDHSVRSS